MKTALRILTAPCVLLLAAGCTTPDRRTTYTTDPYGSTVISAAPSGSSPYYSSTTSPTYSSTTSPTYSSTTSPTYSSTTSPTAAQARSDSILEGQVRQQLGN